MHKDTTKIKRNNAPNNWDENLTYATPSSETTSTSSEHERVSNGHGNETGSQICHVKDLPIDFNRTSGTCQSSSVVHTWRAPEEPNLTLVLLCTRYKRSLYPAQGENGCWLECALLEINCWQWSEEGLSVYYAVAILQSSPSGMNMRTRVILTLRKSKQRVVSRMLSSSCHVLPVNQDQTAHEG